MNSHLVVIILIRGRGALRKNGKTCKRNKKHRKTSIVLVLLFLLRAYDVLRCAQQHTKKRHTNNSMHDAQVIVRCGVQEDIEKHNAK